MPIIDFLSCRNAPVPQLLRSVGFCPEVFASPENLLPLQQCSSFVGRAARREGVEDLGLQAGAATPIASLGFFGLALAQSLTLKDIIQKLIRLVPMLDSGARVWVEAEGENTLDLRAHHDAEDGLAQINAYSLMLLIDAVRMAAGAAWRPRKVTLDSTVAAFAQRHEVLSEAEINGEADYIAVSIPRELLARPVQRISALAPDAMPDARHAEGRLTASAPATDVVGSISQILQSLLHYGPPTLKVVAEMVGASPRTMQRRLAESAISYEEIVDRVRFEKATQLLRLSRTKLSAVAAELGYSDAAHFARAFRRWSGHSPSQYQRIHLQELLATA